jgi:hypothetical protein
VSAKFSRVRPVTLFWFAFMVSWSAGAFLSRKVSRPWEWWITGVSLGLWFDTFMNELFGWVQTQWPQLVSREDGHEVPLVCPKCAASPFEPFLPGQVARSNFWPWHWGRPQHAIICRGCKDIVAYSKEPLPRGLI